MPAGFLFSQALLVKNFFSINSSEPEGEVRQTKALVWHLKLWKCWLDCLVRSLAKTTRRFQTLNFCKEVERLKGGAIKGVGLRKGGEFSGYAAGHPTAATVFLCGPWPASLPVAGCQRQVRQFPRLRQILVFPARRLA